MSPIVTMPFRLSLILPVVPHFLSFLLRKLGGRPPSMLAKQTAAGECYPFGHALPALIFLGDPSSSGKGGKATPQQVPLIPNFRFMLTTVGGWLCGGAGFRAPPPNSARGLATDPVACSAP